MRRTTIEALKSLVGNAVLLLAGHAIYTNYTEGDWFWFWWMVVAVVLLVVANAFHAATTERLITTQRNLIDTYREYYHQTKETMNGSAFLPEGDAVHRRPTD